MSDNIIIRITGESDLSAVNQDLEQLKDQERDIQNEMRKQQAEYTKQLAMIQQTVKGREAQIAAIDKLNAAQTKQQKGLETELSKTKQNLDQFSRSMSNVNDTVAKGAVAAPSLRTQLANVRNELSQMEMAGDASSAAFIKLSVKAGQLQDQMGDTQSQIRILSSDTRGLDTVMGAGQGLAGGFTAATSAAALLGGESEELQQAFFKVQAVMQILNGVNAVAVMLNKDSVVMVNLRTAAETNSTLAKVRGVVAAKLATVTTKLDTLATGGSTVAKVAATVAQWALNAAVYALALPLIAIVAGIAALVAGIAFWINASNNAKKEQELLTKSIDDTSAAIDRLNDRSKKEIEALKAAGASKEVLRKKELDDARAAFKLAQEEEAKQLEAYNNASKKQQKKLKENLDKSHELVINASKAIGEAKQRFYVEDLQAATDADKKALADKEAANDKAKQQAEQYAAYILNIQRQLQDVSIAVMRNGFAKEEAAIRLDFSRKLEAIKGNSKIETDLRIALNKEMNQKINKATGIEAIKGEKMSGDAITKIFEENQEKKSPILTKAEAKLSGIISKGIQNENDLRKEELENLKKDEEERVAIISASVDLIANVGNMLFNAKMDSLAQEMEAIDRNYTTDAEAAKKNANLQLISEEELAAKKLEIKKKQAKVDKEQALFNIAISTAVAIAGALPNVALSIIAGALGAAQAIAVLAQPMPKYAKGLKGGSKGGHFATVGELGAETMWIPNGAAVIPHNRSLDFDTFNDFNVPIDSKLMPTFDYDKMGQAFAKNVKFPKQNNMTVNVDKNGIVLQDGHSTTTYLNKKYSATWN